MNKIRIAVPTFDDNLKRDAYNEVADSEGHTRIEQDNADFDSWIDEALLGPVIDMLVELDGGVSMIQ